MSYLGHFACSLRTVWLAAIVAQGSLAQHFVHPRNMRDGLNEDMKAGFARINPSSNLTWQACGLSKPTFECAVLDVPLDYDAPLSPRASIPLVKFSAASDEKYKGMILYNPGGPGASAIDSLLQSIGELRRRIGPGYDIVAWEPRGVGYSNPVVNCLNPSGADYPREVGANETLNQDDENQIVEKWLEGERVLHNSCLRQMGEFFEAGPHMSTGVIAHDILGILDAFAASKAAQKLQHPELLNYWGVSYGTFIGQTFASMFPDRVGRVVLDGVVDPDDFVSGSLLAAIADTDASFLTFFLSCFEGGPRSCAYHGNATSVIDIFTRFKRMINRLHDEELPPHGLAGVTNTDVLMVIKLEIKQALSNARFGFRYLARTLSALEGLVLHNDFRHISEDGLWLLENVQSYMFATDYYDAQKEAWFLGPMCSDNNGLFYNKSIEDLEPLLKAVISKSYILGFFGAMGIMRCSTWPIKGLGVYSGPFIGDTGNPILFVGNTHDPVTSLLSGPARFSGALHLIVHGIGHTSLALDNKCADKIIHDYFNEGILPNDGYHCPEEPGPFNVTTEHLEQGEDWEVMKAEMQNWRNRSVLGERWRGFY